MRQSDFLAIHGCVDDIMRESTRSAYRLKIRRDVAVRIDYPADREYCCWHSLRVRPGRAQ